MEKSFILSLIFAVAVGLFALNNSERVSIDLIFTTLEISQAIVIFISAFLGAIIVAMLGWVKNLKFKKEIKMLINDRDTLVDDKEILEVDKSKLIEKLELKNTELESLYISISDDPGKNEEKDKKD